MCTVFVPVPECWKAFWSVRENRPDAQASVTCKQLQLFALMMGQQAGQVQISGDATALKRLLAYASKFEKTFNVIEP